MTNVQWLRHVKLKIQCTSKVSSSFNSTHETVKYLGDVLSVIGKEHITKLKVVEQLNFKSKSLLTEKSADNVINQYLPTKEKQKTLLS